MMKVKKDIWKMLNLCHEISSDDFWNKITSYYIIPDNLLKEEADIKRVNDAIEIIKEFEDSLMSQPLD